MNKTIVSSDEHLRVNYRTKGSDVIRTITLPDGHSSSKTFKAKEGMKDMQDLLDNYDYSLAV